MKHYATMMLALLLVVALAGITAAQDMMGGAASAPPAGAKAHMGAGRGGVAPGVSCDKKCIMDVQRKLKEEGIYKGKADGKAGPKTQAAVKKFQGQKGIQATGQIDESTLSALNITPAGKGGAAPSAAPPAGGGAAAAPSGGM